MKLDSILDKLGIYDLVGVELPGVCITVFLSVTLKLIFEIDITKLIPINHIFILLLAGYFLGIIFQELGSLIYRIVLNQNDKMLREVLHSSNSDLYELSSEKAQEIQNIVMEKSGIKSVNDREIYNYCKLYVFEKHGHSYFDKDQSLSAMSRSFACYFFFSAIFCFLRIFSCYNIEALKIIFLFIAFSISLALLMHYRCRRFAKMRYRNILDLFYFDNKSTEFSE